MTDAAHIQAIQRAMRAALDAELTSLRLTALKLEREWAETTPITEVVVTHKRG